VSGERHPEAMDGDYWAYFEPAPHGGWRENRVSMEMCPICELMTDGWLCPTCEGLYGDEYDAARRTRWLTVYDIKVRLRRVAEVTGAETWDDLFVAPPDPTDAERAEHALRLRRILLNLYKV
jgi:hypothetical protein